MRLEDHQIKRITELDEIEENPVGIDDEAVKENLKVEAPGQDTDKTKDSSFKNIERPDVGLQKKLDFKASIKTPQFYQICLLVFSLEQRACMLLLVTNLLALI